MGCQIEMQVQTWPAKFTLVALLPERVMTCVLGLKINVGSDGVTVYVPLNSPPNE